MYFSVFYSAFNAACVELNFLKFCLVLTNDINKNISQAASSAVKRSKVKTFFSSTLVSLGLILIKYEI